MALTYDQIDAHVRSKYIPVLVDNVFTGNPVLTKLMSKNKIMFDSGKSIRVPILYGKKKAGSYSGMDRFDITPVQTRTVAEWNWKAVYANVTIVGDDVDMVEGDEKIIGLVENEIKEAELTLKDFISDMLYKDGTGNNSKDFDGLDNAIGLSSYGGISPADVGDTAYSGAYTGGTWSSCVDSTGGACTLSRIKGLIGNCTYGTEVPDLIITTQTLYDTLWAQVQPQQRYLNPNTPLAKVGWSGIQIDGTQIVVDRHCPSGYMYGLNTDYFKFVIHKKKNFKWTGNKELLDADAYVRQLLLKANLLTTARRYHFKASSLTA